MILKTNLKSISVKYCQVLGTKVALYVPKSKKKQNNKKAKNIYKAELVKGI
jgi:hypothetical protein